MRATVRVQATSANLGQTWTSGNIVIAFDSTVLQRPYVRYASNARDTIHLLYTDAHPRDFDNSLYHIYYRGGMLYRSDGTALGALTQGLASPDQGTRIFQGAPDRVAWSVDIVLDADEQPVAAYSVQMNSAGLPNGPLQGSLQDFVLDPNLLGVGGQMAYYLGFSARDQIRAVATVGAVLASQPKDLVSNQRLQFYIAAGEKDPIVKDIADGKPKLTERKYNVVLRIVKDRGKEYLNESPAAFREMIRWIDSLDRN